MTGAICMAVYRPDGVLLRRQIDSIARQSVTDWVCIIGIDGPDLGAMNLIHEVTAADGRFVVKMFTENVGFYRNFERIIAEARLGYSWVALSDQDDYWYPERLDALLSEMCTPKAKAVCGQAAIVGSDGSFLGITHRRATSLVGLVFENQVTGSLMLFDPSILERALPFPDPTDASYHDHWLGAVAACSGRVMFREGLVQDYVQHAFNTLGEQRGGRFAERFGGLLRRSAESHSDPLAYLALHRWGWRVRIARTLLERFANLPDQESLEAIARGRDVLTTMRLLSRSCLFREVPPARAVSLLLGMLSFRRLQKANVSDSQPTP